MARTITLADMRAGVRRRGGWTNSRRVTTTLLNDVINSAIAEVWDILVEKWADYYATEASLATTVGVDFIALPSTFYKFRKLELRWTTPPDEWVRLRPHDLESSHSFQSKHRTFRYRIQGGQLRFAPTPQTVETLRLTFVPWSTVLVADADTFDGINGYEELVMQLAKLRIEEELKLDTTGAMAEVARLTMRIRTAADGRDAAEPFYLNPRGPRSEMEDEDAEWIW